MMNVTIIATDVSDEDRWMLELSGWVVTERRVPPNITDQVCPGAKQMLICSGREATPEHLAEIKRCFGSRGNVFLVAS